MEDITIMDAEIETMLNSMSEGDNPVATVNLEGIVVHTHLRGNSNLFVPTLNRDDLLDTIGLGPIWMALSGGGTFLMGGEEVIIPAVDIRDLSIKTGWIVLNDNKFDDPRFVRVGLGMVPGSPEVKALRARTNTEDIRIHGLVIRLCPWMIRVQSAFEATLTGVKYNWVSFHKSYRKDIATAMGKMVEDSVLTTPRAALQAHAAFDPRVKENEVGLSVGDARRLGLIAGHQQVEGRKVILGRFPSNGQKGFRFVTVVVLPDQEDGMVYLNAEAWKVYHGGDFDGDLAYVMVDGWEVGEPNSDCGRAPQAQPAGVREYPKMEVLNADPIIDTLVSNHKPVSVEKAVDLVMGMLIKDVIGSLYTTFHVLARSAAVNYASNPSYPGTEKDKMKRAYAGVFDVFFPVSENVFDARKDLGNHEALNRVAHTLQNVMNGGAIDSEAFNVFLPEGMDVKFQHMVHLASGMKTNIATLAAVRNTATGRLIAAGRGGRARATDNVIQSMLRRGVDPDNILHTLQKDAMGEEFFYQGKRNANNQVSDELDEEQENQIAAFRILNTGSTIKSIFEDIRYNRVIAENGKQVFQVLSVEELNGSSRMVSVIVRLTAHWVEGMVPTMKIRVDVPNPIMDGGDERRASEDGHMIIQVPNCQPRMYRPRLMNVEGQLVMEDFAGYLKTVLVRALEVLVESKEKNVNRADNMVNSVILQSFRDDLQLIQQKTKVNGLKLKQTTSCMMLRAEYPLVIQKTKDTVKDWEAREELLRLAAAAGFDILSTSKNKPGQVVAKAGKFGLPNYLLAVNPFALYLDPKRRPEIREIKKREPLHWKNNAVSFPKVRRAGVSMPVAMAEGMREVVCMIADTNLNNFGQDTLTCTEALWENLKLAMFDLEADTLEQVEQRLNDLKLQGFDISKVKISHQEDRMEGGIVGESHIITVEQEDGIRDAGKIKSTIGPVKGVPSLIPGLRLFANGREIELIVPRETIERKKGIDFWLAMAYEAAAYQLGVIVEIDPEQSLEELVRHAKDGLKSITGNEDGLVDVVDQEGNFVCRAFVGAVPFFRPTQTKIGTFRKRGLNNPCHLELHAAILADTNLTTDKKVAAKFADYVRAFRGSSVITNEEVSDRV